MNPNKDRMDKAAGRALHVLYGLQVLGIAGGFLIASAIAWFVGARLIAGVGLALVAGLVAVAVRSMMRRGRFSELDPDAEGIQSF